MKIKTSKKINEKFSYYKNYLPNFYNLSLNDSLSKKYNFNDLKKTSNNLNNLCDYIVKLNDNLWDISLFNLGDGFKYKEIIENNNLSSKIIYPGQKLKINCNK